MNNQAKTLHVTFLTQESFLFFYNRSKGKYVEERFQYSKQYAVYRPRYMSGLISGVIPHVPYRRRTVRCYWPYDLINQMAPMPIYRARQVETPHTVVLRLTINWTNRNIWNFFSAHYNAPLLSIAHRLKSLKINLK